MMLRMDVWYIRKRKTFLFWLVRKNIMCSETIKEVALPIIDLYFLDLLNFIFFFFFCWFRVWYNEGSGFTDEMWFEGSVWCVCLLIIFHPHSQLSLLFSHFIILFICLWIRHFILIWYNKYVFEIFTICCCLHYWWEIRVQYRDYYIFFYSWCDQEFVLTVLVWFFFFFFFHVDTWWYEDTSRVKFVSRIYTDPLLHYWSSSKKKYPLHICNSSSKIDLSQKTLYSLCRPKSNLRSHQLPLFSFISRIWSWGDIIVGGYVRERWR